MRSKANIKGHPIHPALIPFPFAFLYGALFFDAAGVLLGSAGLWTTGAHLSVAGVVMALVAAVPGAVDYFNTVPPRSSGKKRATRHALFNLSAVGLFVAARLVRGDATDAPGMHVLGMEAIAAGLLGAGAWMGGTLVSRNQIGVDHRYAGAGKWKDERVDAEPGRPLVAARAGELEVDQMKLLRVGDRRIVLGRTEDGYVAFDDHCTHRGGSLAGGAMICGTVQCPWHGSQFDVRTGAVKAGPASDGIATYRVEQAGDDVRLVLEAALV